MDPQRRIEVEKFWSTVYGLSLRCLFAGFGLSVVGLVTWILIQELLLLWPGIAFLALGVIGWFISSVSAMGLARMDVEPVLRRPAERAVAEERERPVVVPDGAVIELDDEEAAVIRPVQAQIEGFKGKRLKPETFRQLAAGLISSALVGEAERRLREGRLDDAEATAIKALSFESVANDWRGIWLSRTSTLSRATGTLQPRI